MIYISNIMTTLTDKQWAVIKPHLPKQIFLKGGRPRANDRKTINGIVWVLRTGSQWSEMPGKYGSYTTCWRRLKDWQDKGIWENIWQALLKELEKEGKIDWERHLIDGSFAPAKKGGRRLDSREKARVQK